MIKLKSLHVEEFRGIRKLDIPFNSGPFAISGPNGSGKSGVIDAIEFGLTGHIGRLAGTGTQGLSVAEHGPHVDKTKFPDAAVVELDVLLTRLNKSVKITRKVSAPKKPVIVPNDQDVMAALTEVAEHPEITLSRREILRFILVAPSKRSEEIQTLLKLDDLGLTRSTLNSAQNKLQVAQRAAAAHEKASLDALLSSLQLTALKAEDVMNAVNAKRGVLELAPITDLDLGKRLDDGIKGAAEIEIFNKQSALRDLAHFTQAALGFPKLANAELAELSNDLAKLETDPALLTALQKLSFLEQGLELLDGPDCPLCDTSWHDEEVLATHLRAKLTKSHEAQQLSASMLKNGGTLAAEIVRVIELLAQLQKLSQTLNADDVTKSLLEWKADLNQFKGKLTSISGLIEVKSQLKPGAIDTPAETAAAITRLNEHVAAKPDQTATIHAQTFLATAQLRLDEYRKAKRQNTLATTAHSQAKAATDLYVEVSEGELNALYDSVEADFSAFYRAINGSDESQFTAKLSPSAGKLDFLVNFYERGLFPPGAYHSEGHQDGMGVCLYLALMKQLFGADFTFALLDDVVTSVDTGHRRQFCKLLKQSFPETQFIITTHDRLWAEQMKAAGLVTAKTSLAFHSWTIDTGPLVESNDEIWVEISSALGRGKVEAAAAALRHHLEYISRMLADQLSAAVPFRGDGNYELGDLLPNVIGSINVIYGKAANAAQSWGDTATKEAAVKRKELLSSAYTASGAENWAVNKAVHYNEWANFGKTDFTPVVSAFKDLLDHFRCAKCASWLHVSPRTSPETLRCECNGINFNLKAKQK